MEDFDLENSRYASAIGWEPKAEPAKRVKKRPVDPAADPPAFDVDNGVSLQRVRTNSRPERLFGDLWREDEVAVLFGPSGAGKSVLAVQLAESIARGPLSRRTGRRRRVIYIDLEHTLEQFRRRYSAGETGRPVYYRFSSRFARARVAEQLTVPDRHDRNIYAYFREQVQLMIAGGEADAVIIDSAEHLVPSASGGAMAQRLVKRFKHTAGGETAVLLVMHARAKRRPGVLTADDIAGGSAVADIADSVFAIAPSRFGDDIRYIKHIKSKSAPLTLDESSVAVYKLERSLRPETWIGHLPDPSADPLPISDADSLPASRVTLLPPENIVPARAGMLLTGLQPVRSFAPPAVDRVAKPFLGLTHLGHTPESIHLAEPELKRVRSADRPDPARLAEEKRLKRIRKNTVEMLLSPEYQRYLKG